MKLDYFLYLLPFKDGKLFKIGFSSENFLRIHYLHEIYDFDPDKILIITANKNNTIKVLEKELLNTFEPEKLNKQYEFLDGYTELRSMKYFKKSLRIIKSKYKSLGINIHEYKKLSIEYFPTKYSIFKENIVGSHIFDKHQCIDFYKKILNLFNYTEVLSLSASEFTVKGRELFNEYQERIFNPMIYIKIDKIFKVYIHAGGYALAEDTSNFIFNFEEIINELSKSENFKYKIWLYRVKFLQKAILNNIKPKINNSLLFTPDWI